jgi:hypothetical protein
MSSLPAANGSNLLLGRGEIYVDKYVSGVKTGELFLGNCTSFAISTKDDMKEKYTSTKATSTLLKRIPVHRTVEMKIEGDEFSIENMEFMLMGTSGTLTQTGASVTGETLSSSVALGRYYPTLYRNISAVTVKAGVSGATAMTNNTDYIIDADGRIYTVPGGAIVAGDILKADYTYATISGYSKLAGGYQSYIEAFIRFKGKPTNGPQYEVTAWKVNLTPNGDLGFISDDFGKWQLQGLLLDDTANHATSPYYDIIKTA